MQKTILNVKYRNRGIGILLSMYQQDSEKSRFMPFKTGEGGKKSKARSYNVLCLSVSMSKNNKNSRLVTMLTRRLGYRLNAVFSELT